MYHIILIAIIATMTLGVWNLVHSAPRAITMLLPPTVALVGGASLLIFGAFFAFAAAVLVQSGEGMAGFLLQAHVGLFFMLLAFREDEDTIRRSFVMFAALLATLIAIFYLQNAYATALLMLCLLATGYFVLTAGPRFLDRER